MPAFPEDRFSLFLPVSRDGALFQVRIIDSFPLETRLNPGGDRMSPSGSCLGRRWLFRRFFSSFFLPHGADLFFELLYAVQHGLGVGCFFGNLSGQRVPGCAAHDATSAATHTSAESAASHSPSGSPACTESLSGSGGTSSHCSSGHGSFSCGSCSIKSGHDCLLDAFASVIFPTTSAPAWLRRRSCSAGFLEKPEWLQLRSCFRRGRCRFCLCPKRQKPWVRRVR